MERHLHVIHSDGEDVFPDGPLFGIEEGILTIYSDRARNDPAHAYNCGDWARVGYREVT